MASEGALVVGFEVSAKYKGTFCEAVIKNVDYSLEARVDFAVKGKGSHWIQHSGICGPIRLRQKVEACHPDGHWYEGTVIRIADNSLYTVVFDDGDSRLVRRQCIHLKTTTSDTLVCEVPISIPEPERSARSSRMSALTSVGTDRLRAHSKKHTTGKRECHVNATQSLLSQQKTSSGLVEKTKAKRVTVFVNTVGCAFWKPALLVPDKECDVDMPRKRRPSDCIVRYLDNFQYDCVSANEVSLFGKETSQYRYFVETVGALFSRDSGVFRALAYVDTGAVPDEMLWSAFRLDRANLLDVKAKPLATIYTAATPRAAKRAKSSSNLGSSVAPQSTAAMTNCVAAGSSCANLNVSNALPSVRANGRALKDSGWQPVKGRDLLNISCAVVASDQSALLSRSGKTHRIGVRNRGSKRGRESSVELSMVGNFAEDTMPTVPERFLNLCKQSEIKDKLFLTNDMKPKMCKTEQHTQSQCVSDASPITIDCMASQGIKKETESPTHNRDSLSCCYEAGSNQSTSPSPTRAMQDHTSKQTSDGRETRKAIEKVFENPTPIGLSSAGMCNGTAAPGERRHGFVKSEAKTSEKSVENANDCGQPGRVWKYGKNDIVWALSYCDGNVYHAKIMDRKAMSAGRLGTASKRPAKNHYWVNYAGWDNSYNEWIEETNVYPEHPTAKASDHKKRQSMSATAGQRARAACDSQCDSQCDCDKDTQQHTSPERDTQEHTSPERDTQQHTSPERDTQQHTSPERDTQQHTLPERDTQQHTTLERATQQHTPPERATQQQTPPERDTQQQTPPERDTQQHTPPERATQQHMPPPEYDNGIATAVKDRLAKGNHGPSMAGTHQSGRPSGLCGDLDCQCRRAMGGVVPEAKLFGPQSACQRGMKTKYGFVNGDSKIHCKADWPPKTSLHRVVNNETAILATSLTSTGARLDVSELEGRLQLLRVLYHQHKSELERLDRTRKARLKRGTAHTVHSSHSTPKLHKTHNTHRTHGPEECCGFRTTCSEEHSQSMARASMTPPNSCLCVTAWHCSTERAIGLAHACRRPCVARDSMSNGQSCDMNSPHESAKASTNVHSKVIGCHEPLDGVSFSLAEAAGHTASGSLDTGHHQPMGTRLVTTTAADM